MSEVFRETYPGGWEKTIVQRSDGVSLDAYISHPAGKKFRSSNDLLKFIQGNPWVLKELDPYDVNFSKKPGQHTGAIKKFIEQVEDLKKRPEDEVGNLTADILKDRMAPKEKKEGGVKKARDPNKPKSSKGPSELKCEKCGKLFERSLVGKIRLRKHMKKRHDIDLAEKKKSSSSSTTNSKGPSEVKCSVCGKRFESGMEGKIRLKKHIRIYHPHKLKDDSDPKRKENGEKKHKHKHRDRDREDRPKHRDDKPREDVMGMPKPKKSEEVFSNPFFKSANKNDDEEDRPKTPETVFRNPFFQSDDKEEEDKPKTPETVFRNPFFQSDDKDSEDEKQEDKEENETTQEEDKPKVFVNPFFGGNFGGNLDDSDSE